jgi:hypothetical protein
MKSSGLKRVGCFAKLQFYEDILFLVSGISISKRFRKLTPRPSYKARLYNQRYKIPIEVDVKSLLRLNRRMQFNHSLLADLQ